MPEKEASSETINKIKVKRLEPMERWEAEGGSLPMNHGQDDASDKQAPQLTTAMRDLLDSMPLAVMISNQHGEIIHCNPACEQLLARETSQLQGLHWRQTLDPRDLPSLPEDNANPRADAKHQAFEARLAIQTGAPVWTRQTIAPWSLDMNTELIIHTLEDISVSKARSLKASAEKAALVRDREHARFTLECIGDAVISIDIQGRISYMNKVAEQLTGWTRKNAIGQPFMSVFRVVDSTNRIAAQDPAQLAMDADGIVQLAANCSLLRADGSELEIEDSAAPIKDADGRSSGAVVVFRDRRYSRATTSKMSYLARHDPLTDLGNRIALIEQFDQAIYLADQNHDRLAVLFCDLDNFKIVNDALGHSAGDRILRCVADALSNSVRATDAVFRYGGDEFVILLRGVSLNKDAARVACKLQEAVSQCMRNGLEGNVTLSVGISLYPDHASTSDGLLRAADAAMYEAKKMGKSSGNSAYCFFHTDLLSTELPDRRRNRVEVATRSNEHDPPE